MSYQPTNVPQDAPPGLAAWIVRQLRQIAQTLLNPTPTTVTLAVLGREPSNPTNGMVVYADGTQWNPGSGAGFYGYRSGAWRKLD